LLAPDTLQEIVLTAKQRLAPPVWEFIIGGADSETTVRRNRNALDRLAFRPETLTDVSHINCTQTFLGHHMSMPVVLAPMGSISLIDPNGAVAAVEAANAAQLVSFMSGVADPGPERVAAAARCPVVYTLYVSGDAAWLDATLDHVQSLGFSAIAVLADTAYYSRRDRDIINQLASKLDADRSYAAIQRKAREPIGTVPELSDLTLHAARITWKTIEHIKRRTKLPVIVKGVCTPEAARRSIDAGADAIYVSNHGGRQLDHQIGSFDCLPEIVDAVNGATDIVVDGGVVRGADIVKGIALGATAVGIGRIQALALGAGGAPMLIRALEILKEELTINLGLIGVTSLDALSPQHLRTVDPLIPAHVFAPFPLVMESLKTPD